MMPDKFSISAANAQRQKDEIMKRVLMTRKAIRDQIRRSYDKASGRSRYLIKKNGKLVEKKRFHESDFLKHSGIDKNTLKREYHEASRKMVARLILWVNAKIASETPGSGEPVVGEKRQPFPPYHALIAAERDAIAEKYGILEIELSNALRAKRVVESERDAALAELATTRQNVASLTDILLEIGSAKKVNVLPLTRSDE